MTLRLQLNVNTKHFLNGMIVILCGPTIPLDSLSVTDIDASKVITEMFILGFS